MSTFAEVLRDLESLLDNEELALKKLDSRLVEELTQQKSNIEVQLRAAIEKDAPQPGQHDESISRVRDKAQRNQMLTVHARAIVRGILDEAGIKSAPTSFVPGRQAPAQPAAPQALRLDTRG